MPTRSRTPAYRGASRFWNANDPHSTNGIGRNANVATTGAIALGDSLIQQIVGHGLAARLSAKLGEGVVNGLLTARIGIAAIDVCRPMPFIGEKRPGVSDFLSELVRLNAPKSDRGRLHVGESAKPEKETKRNAS